MDLTVEKEQERGKERKDAYVNQRADSLELVLQAVVSQDTLLKAQLWSSGRTDHTAQPQSNLFLVPHKVENVSYIHGWYKLNF